MRNWLRKFTPDHTAVHDNRWLAPFRNTLLHPRLWHLNRHSAAGGVAVGMFCGLLPPPFQMVSAALCAVLFRINLPLAIFTTLYTNPVTFVPLYVFAYWVGSLLLGSTGSFVPPPAFDATNLASWLAALLAWLGLLGWPLVVGVSLLATIFAATSYFAVRMAWRIYLIRAWHRRRLHRTQSPVAQ